MWQKSPSSSHLAMIDGKKETRNASKVTRRGDFDPISEALIYTVIGRKKAAG